MDQADDVLARLRLRATLTKAADSAAEAPLASEAPRHRSGGGASGGYTARRGSGVSPGSGPGWRWRELLGRCKVSPAAGLGAGLAVLLLLVAVLVWRSGDTAAGESAGQGGQETAGLVVTVPPSGASLPVPTAATGETPIPPTVLVYVVGAVVTPGVVELPAGARVLDALGQAGGALPGADLTVLNLAAVVVDGERIYVPLPGETPPAVVSGGGGLDQGSGAGAGASGSDLVNVNTASAEQLTTLPGIGPVLAGRMVDFRDSHGPFVDLADLSQVSGIGPKLTASLEGLVAF